MTREEFLQIIGQIESSGGKNTNHPVLKTGMHKGSSAIGKYALMPLTINELVKNNPQLQYLAQMDEARKRATLENNQALQDQLAGMYYDKAAKNSNSDQEAAYKWLHGYNSRPTEQNLQNDEYTNKFNRLTQKLGNNTTVAANNMPKNENNLQNSVKNLPTNNIASLEDILNDPNNPFNEDDEELAQYF
jgi:uncharacterized protein (UPF0147 family)